MARSMAGQFTAKDLLLALSMIGIAVAVVLVGNNSLYKRSKAFTQTATGVRIEAEEMTLTGSATKDSGGAFVQF